MLKYEETGTIKRKEKVDETRRDIQIISFPLRPNSKVDQLQDRGNLVLEHEVIEVSQQHWKTHRLVLRNLSFLSRKMDLVLDQNVLGSVAGREESPRSTKVCVTHHCLHASRYA